MPTAADEKQVVVVGAGLSGLSAALRLHTHGIAVLVLEAQSQPGGRVRSVRLPKPPVHPSPEPRTVELGATFFHGTRGNAAYDLAVASRLYHPQQTDDVDETSSHNDLFSRQGRLVSSNGQVHLSSLDESRRIAQLYSATIAELQSSHYRMQGDNDTSVLHHAREKADYNALGPEGRAIFRACDLLQSVIEGCGSSTAGLSSASMHEYTTLRGADVCSPIDGGMSRLVRALSSQLPNGCVLLNAEVTRISYGPDVCEEVLVHLADRRQIEAACVVWTPSVNVTKAACNEGVFDPPLSHLKLSALNDRRLGIVERVYAILEASLQGAPIGVGLPVFWEEEVRIDTSTARGADCPLKTLSECVDWSDGIYAVDYDEQSLCVDFWLVGRYATALSSRTDEQARREVSSVLSLIFEQAVAVRAVVRSAWGENRFTRGSYSSARVGASSRAVEMLAAPLPSVERPVLCFAGEATHGSFYSTMHGAIESGVREGQRCVDYIGKLRKASEGAAGRCGM